MDFTIRSYEIPVVKDSVNYTDALLKSYSLSAAAYRNAEALATTVYKKAGEPLQDKLQPQVRSSPWSDKLGHLTSYSASPDFVGHPSRLLRSTSSMESPTRLWTMSKAKLPSCVHSVKSTSSGNAS